MGFSRQEYWSGLPFPSPENLPDSGDKPSSPPLAGEFFTTEPPGKPKIEVTVPKLGKIYLEYLSTDGPPLMSKMLDVTRRLCDLCILGKLAMVSDGVEWESSAGMSLRGQAPHRKYLTGCSSLVPPLLFSACVEMRWPSMLLLWHRLIIPNKHFITPSIFANCFKSLWWAMWGMLLS